MNKTTPLPHPTIPANVQSQITERSAHLAAIARELKSELFGIDDVIDRVMASVRAWYVLPQIINRPVIVCLWGLTGTGKTQLTRSLAQKLGFYSRFVEVQMDGFSNDGGRRASTISGMLADTVPQGEAGILVLDEFQRFRTIDPQGKEVRVERYMDVWTLLSDGRLAPSLSFMEELQMSLADTLYRDDRLGAHTDGSDSLFDHGADPEPDGSEVQSTELLQAGMVSTPLGSSPHTARPARRFSLSPYEAKEIRSSLKLREPLTEIMTWSRAQVMDRLQAFCDNPAAWETDYSKLLIFVCGNLDEMYTDLATRVEDCDSDADVFHAMTRKLSVIDVKRALTQRFKPEQIARLGNTHIVYPSFSRATFERLVASTAERYVQDVQVTSGLKFCLSRSLLDQLYVNGVFPAQGTRPLFSSIHSILSAALVHFTLWAMEQGAVPGDRVELDVLLGEVLHAGGGDAGRDIQLAHSHEAHEKPHLQDAVEAQLVASCRGQSASLPVVLEILQLKERRDSDFTALLAVHEAGHGLVYTLLFEQAPLEIKIHVAAYSGGYNTLAGRKVTTRKDMRNAICVDLAGRAAEELVFGPDQVTTGAMNDLRHATAMAAEFVRYVGFGERISRTDRVSDESENVNTDMVPTNTAIEALLQQEYQRARDILGQHRPALMSMVSTLQVRGSVSRQEVLDRVVLGSEHAGIDPFEELLDQFATRQ